MARPIILGVVGDSASGKTTLTRGLVRVLGQEQVSHVCLDDYHRYDRAQRAGMDVTPLAPGCNHMDVMAQHLKLLRCGEPILKRMFISVNPRQSAQSVVILRRANAPCGMCGSI